MNNIEYVNKGGGGRKLDNIGSFTRQTSKTLEQTGLGYLFILNFIQIQINFV